MALLVGIHSDESLPPVDSKLISSDEALALIKSNSYIIGPEQHDSDRVWGLAIHYQRSGGTVLEAFRSLLSELAIEDDQLDQLDQLIQLDLEASNPQVILRKVDDQYFLIIELSFDAQEGPQGPSWKVDEEFVRHAIDSAKVRGYILYDSACCCYRVE